MNDNLNKKPKLAVGQVWKDGYGSLIELKYYRAGEDVMYPFEAVGGSKYTEEGCYIGDDVHNDFDLVELVRDVQAQTDSSCSHQGLQAVLNKHKSICMHFKSTDEFVEFKYSHAKELDDCIIFYGTNLTPGWGHTSVFYNSEIVCMHLAEEGVNDE